MDNGFQNSGAGLNIPFLAIEIFYYICLVIATFVGCSIVYVLIKYAKSRNLAYTASLVFAIIFLGLVASGMNTLDKIKQ